MTGYTPPGLVCRVQVAALTVLLDLGRVNLESVGSALTTEEIPVVLGLLGEWTRLGERFGEHLGERELERCEKSPAPSAVSSGLSTMMLPIRLSASSSLWLMYS